MENLAFVFYSHDSLKWIWPAFVGELNKYFPVECKKYFIVNQSDDLNNDFDFPEFEIIEYSDDQPYAFRLLESLSQIKEEFILIHHEDMIFYDDVDMDQFEYYLDILKENKQFAYIKLLRGGLSAMPPQEFASGIYYVQDDEAYRYAVQPAIWRKSDLERVLTFCITNNIYQLEEAASQYMAQSKMQSLFAYNQDDPKRGMYHWDNTKYPYIATALVKGRWNDSEYDIEIENLKREYDLK